MTHQLNFWYSVFTQVIKCSFYKRNFANQSSAIGSLSFSDPFKRKSINFNNFIQFVLRYLDAISLDHLTLKFKYSNINNNLTNEFHE
jgi:hypothetical protein